MSIPPELAWLVPIAVPFIIGLLIGVVIKTAAKLAIVIVIIVIVLVFTGVLGLTFQDIFTQALEFLPKLFGAGSGLLNLLPYSSVAFLIGLGLGILS